MELENSPLNWELSSWIRNYPFELKAIELIVYIYKKKTPSKMET